MKAASDIQAYKCRDNSGSGHQIQIWYPEPFDNIQNKIRPAPYNNVEVVHMTDFQMLEQIQRMIKEMPRPRLLFRKGLTVCGFFRPYMSFADRTRADIFGSTDMVTPVTVRFASMFGQKGTADTVRNIKGMSVKFHGSQEYDMVCHSIPVFFIDEKQKLPELIRAFTRREHCDGLNSRRFWEFIAENPESLHCALRLFSYEGIAGTFINIKWFSVNTTVWENHSGEKWFVRYRWVPSCAAGNGADWAASRETVNDRITAEFMAGFDCDTAFKELVSDISEGRFPSFDLYVQMIPESDFDTEEHPKRTIEWDEERVPCVLAGVMRITELAGERENMHDLTSFIPGRAVKGIELYRDGLEDLMDFLYRTEAMERGSSY